MKYRTLLLACCVLFVAWLIRGTNFVRENTTVSRELVQSVVDIAIQRQQERVWGQEKGWVHQISKDIGVGWRDGWLEVDITVKEEAISQDMVVVLLLGEQKLQSKLQDSHHFRFLVACYRNAPPWARKMEIWAKQRNVLTHEMSLWETIALPDEWPSHNTTLMNNSSFSTLNATLLFLKEEENVHYEDEDVTESFLGLYETNACWKASNGTMVMLVKGFFTDMYPIYLSSVRKRLDECNISHITPSIGTQSSCDSNADILAEEMHQHEHVVIVSHSKGVTDVVHMLAKYPSLISRVQGHVAMVGVIGGAPAAKILRMHAPELVDLLLSALHGTGDSLSCIDYEERQAFSHPYPKEQIPTVALTSFTKFEHQGLGEGVWRQVMGLVHHVTAYSYGVLTDGLVSPQDARIDGSKRVYLDDCNHAEMAMHIPGSKWEAARIVLSLLNLLDT